MKLVISGGGGSEFRVQHVNREDLIVSSALTGVQAVEAVAAWLAVKPEAPVEVVVEADKGHATFRSKSTPPKGGA